MDTLTVALGAGIGIVVVAIIGTIVMLARRGKAVDDELWATPATPGEPELTPFWEHELADVVRPLPPSSAKVELDPAARSALTAWQDAEGELLDRWLSRHEARLKRIAEADDRSAAYTAVLKEMSAAEERLVHEAIARTPDAELRDHLEAMQKSAIDALIEATKGDIAASSHAYTSYVRNRTLSEARMEALEPDAPAAPAAAPAAAPSTLASAAAAVQAARAAPAGKPLDPASAPPAPTPNTASTPAPAETTPAPGGAAAMPTRQPRTGPSTDEQPPVDPAT